jgi:uracil-DNA glycosylase family 4
MAMAEALGEEEERDGKPLRPYAQAGSMWERLLRLCKLDRQQLVHYNVVNCRPPKNWLEHAPWEFPAINHCQVHRDRVINQYKPRVILALGNVASRTLTGLAGEKKGVMYLRGYWFDTPHGIVCPTLHPSFLQRGEKRLIPVVADDIEKALRISDLLLRGQRPERKPVQYIHRATLDDAWSFYYKVKDSPEALVVYDIETPSSATEDEDKRGTIMEEEPEDPDDEPIKRWPQDYSVAAEEMAVTQIQFSISPYTGIVFPWEGQFITIAKLILELMNRKAGWNNWDFDDTRLRANGCRINGPTEDFMWKWHHLQPDLPAGLQFATSMMGMDFPWKHLALEGDMGEYGCADVDAPQRAAAVLERALKAKGVERGYERHIRRLAPILWCASDRGIPVNVVKLKEFEDKITLAQDELADQKIRPKVQGMDLGNIEPKDGFKTLRSPELKALFDQGLAAEQITALPYRDKDGHIYHYVQREFVEPTKVDLLRDPVESAPAPVPIVRWCRQFDFNPGSANQIKGYMRIKGHPIPKAWKTERETTARIELERLAAKVGDSFYTDILEYRKFDKMISTYCVGWRPKEDGCVHTTWTFRPAIGQLSSRGPNIQNAPAHVELAEEFRDCVEAPTGYKIVELDYKSFFVITLGFEAKDPHWIRLGRLDIHSYLGAHALHLPERNKLLSMPDDELADRLKWIKQNYRHDRDYKWKRCVLGYNNGMGYRKLFHQAKEYFSSETECKKLLQTLNGEFPIAAGWREQIKHEAQRGHRLLSRHGYHRLFHDVLVYWGMGRIEDAIRRGRKVPVMCPICKQRHDNGEEAEQAIAFLPANDAFGHIKDAVIRLSGNDEGQWNREAYMGSWLGRSGFCNTIHDSLMFIMPEHLVDEAVPAIYNEMVKPSQILIDPEIAPNGLVCDVEASIGKTWKKSAMETISIRTGMSVPA